MSASGVSSLISSITDSADTTSGNFENMLAYLNQQNQLGIENRLAENEDRRAQGRFDMEKFMHNVAMRDLNEERKKQRDLQTALRRMGGRVVVPAANGTVPGVQ